MSRMVVKRGDLLFAASIAWTLCLSGLMVYVIFVH